MKTFCAFAVICFIVMVQIASGKTYYYGKDIRSHLGLRYSEGAEEDDLFKVAKCIYEGLYYSEETQATQGVDKTKLKEAYDWIEESKEYNESVVEQFTTPGIRRSSQLQRYRLSLQEQRIERLLFKQPN